MIDSHWAIHPAALRQILAKAEAGEESAAILPAVGFERDGGVGVVHVVGPLFARPSLFSALFGGANYETLAASIASADADPCVESIRLSVDTPGGAIAGLDLVAAAIDEATKPVEVFVAGMCCSAGVWLASSADSVTLTPTSVMGSLGVVVEVVEDAAGVQTVVSSQTPNKLLNGENAQGFADRMAATFLEDISARRGVPVADLLTATDGGGLLIGEEAVAAGLADRVSRRPTLDFTRALDQRAENRHNIDAEAQEVTVSEEEIQAMQEELAELRAKVAQLTAENEELREAGADEGADGDSGEGAAEAAFQALSAEHTRLKAENAGLKAQAGAAKKTAAIEALLEAGDIRLDQRAHFEAAYDAQTKAPDAAFKPFDALVVTVKGSAVVKTEADGHGDVPQPETPGQKQDGAIRAYMAAHQVPYQVAAVMIYNQDKAVFPR